MIGWFTQPYTNLPLLDGPEPHWAHSEYVAQHWSVMIGWSTQPFTNLPLLDGPGPHWAHSECVAQHKKPDGIGTLPSYVSRKPHWNLVGLLGGHRKRLKKWSIKTKISKQKIQKQLTTLLYTQCIQYTYNTQIMTPLESTYKQCVGRQNVGVPPKQRCANVAYVRS